MVDLNKLSRSFYWHPEHAPSLERVEAFARQVAVEALDEVERRIVPYCDHVVLSSRIEALKREICGEEKKS